MISEYDSWIGKKEAYADHLIEINSTRLHSSLNLSGKPPSYGVQVFPLALLMLGEPSVPTDELGIDGHPARRYFMPPVPLNRRMFAGGGYDIFQPLRVGDHVKVIL